jgi:hypothetical protein
MFAGFAGPGGGAGRLGAAGGLHLKGHTRDERPAELGQGKPGHTATGTSLGPLICPELDLL